MTRIPVCRECLHKPAPLVAEHFCSHCRTPFANAHPLDDQGRCALCKAGVNGFDAAYTFGSFEGELRDLIHLFKYSGIRTLARPLGQFLASALPRERDFDVIVPMPLHWSKRWQRGFNQSRLLALEIGRKSNVPVRNLVRRVRATSAQAGLTHAKRRTNVAGAFRAAKRGQLEGKRVLLIDDVMTTGATASACALALKRAGARQVTFLAVARVDRRHVVDVSKALDEGKQVPDSFSSGSFLHAKSGSLA